jgi:hypothetical protein
MTNNKQPGGLDEAVSGDRSISDPVLVLSIIAEY